MSKKYKIGLIVVITFLILVIALFVYYKLGYKKNNEINNKVVDEIVGFDYSMKENDPKILRAKFAELKKVLAASSIEYDKYAKLLSQIFVIDVYDLKSKVNRYDIGGVDYLYPQEQEKFKLILSDTLYDGILDNSDQKRTQILPEIKDTSVQEIKNSQYPVNDTDFEAYQVKVKIDYVKDLGYDKEATLILIKDKEKLYVVSCNER